MARGAIYVQDSGNSKLAGDKKIDATYSSIKRTCDASCPLKQTKTCYAMSSFVGMQVRKLDRKARQYSVIEMAEAEAKCIDNAYKGGRIPAGRDLRVHVSGDASTPRAARILSRAVNRWLKRGGQAAFTYTHSHKNVKRADWGKISVLASIENTSQVDAVRKMGYSPALVVSEHTTDKAHVLPGSDTVFIPCPSQTKGIHCSTCRLCMKGDWLYSQNKGISFAAHGIMKGQLKKHLTVIQ